MQGLQPIIFMLLMFGVFWFILIRPQMKRQKEHQALLAGIKKGDMVVTRGGLVGKVCGVSDKMLTIELQEKVRVRVLRSHIDSLHDASVSREAKSDTAKAA